MTSIDDVNAAVAAQGDDAKSMSVDQVFLETMKRREPFLYDQLRMAAHRSEIEMDKEISRGDMNALLAGGVISPIPQRLPTPEELGVSRAASVSPDAPASVPTVRLGVTRRVVSDEGVKETLDGKPVEVIAVTPEENGGTESTKAAAPPPPPSKPTSRVTAGGSGSVSTRG